MLRQIGRAAERAGQPVQTLHNELICANPTQRADLCKPYTTGWSACANPTQRAGQPVQTLHNELVCANPTQQAG